MAFELMNTQEIHEFGLQVLLQHLTEKGFEIEFAQPNKSEIPHVVAKQGEQLIFILVATDVYPIKVLLPILISRHYWNMLKLLQHSLLVLIWNRHADGVVNKDKELCAKAFKNAQFYTDFSGLEFIHFED